METSNGGDEAQSQPISDGTAAAFETVKALEDVFALFDRNSRPIVSHKDGGGAILVSNVDGHVTIFATMLDGVVDQIGHRIEQEVSITRDNDRRISDRGEMHTFFLGGGIE